MSSLALLDPYGLDFYSNDLTDPSYKSLTKRYDLCASELNILRQFDRSAQTEAQLMSTDILDWYLENTAEGKNFIQNGCPVNQYLGLQKELPKFMCNTHVILNKGDAKDYIARLNGFDKYFNEILNNLKTSEQNGVMPPKFVVEETLTDMESFINLPAMSNSLFKSFKKKVAALKITEGLSGVSEINCLL